MVASTSGINTLMCWKPVLTECPALARSPDPDPMGKLDERIDVNVPAEMKDDAAFVARATGFKTTAHWVRFLIRRELYGRVSMIQMVVEAGESGNGGNLG